MMTVDGTEEGCSDIFGNCPAYVEAVDSIFCTKNGNDACTSMEIGVTDLGNAVDGATGMSGIKFVFDQSIPLPIQISVCTVEELTIEKGRVGYSDGTDEFFACTNPFGQGLCKLNAGSPGNAVTPSPTQAPVQPLNAPAFGR